MEAKTSGGSRVTGGGAGVPLILGKKTTERRKPGRQAEQSLAPT